jgi:maleylacetoacetate isomerase
MKLTLYHYWRSSCSWRVRWALALKGVSYDSVPVNILKGEQRAPEYLKHNPAGFLPALVVDGKPYGESLAICEWIDETWPTPALLPKDPKDKMLVRQLALTIASGTQPLQNPSVTKYFVPNGTDDERNAHAKHFIAKGLGVYETLLKRGKPGQFSFGDQVTLADICLIPQVYNAKRFNVDMSVTPLVAAIYDRALKTKACDAAAPHNQPGAS